MARRIAGPLSRRGLSFCLLCGLSFAWVDAAGANATVHIAAPEAGGLLDFDIPAQPLEAALYQYGEISLLPALYPSELPASLRSSAVRGRYSAQAALQLLLQGTGLVAEKMSTDHGDVFRLKRTATAPPLPDTVDSARAGSKLDGYPSLLQAGVLQVLCANARTAPGRYRALFEIQVDAAGQAGDAALIDSTGDSRRDVALLAALRQVHTRPPPPSSVRVPYVITLLPAASGAATFCGAQAGGSP